MKKQPFCNYCFGPVMELGRLGSLVHYRCRWCGMDSSAPAPVKRKRSSKPTLAARAPESAQALETLERAFGEPRPLHVIALEISRDWRNVNYAAAPYLAALASLSSLDQAYGADDARGIVRYFLSNARAWRGPVAKRIKAELRRMLEGS